MFTIALADGFPECYHMQWNFFEKKVLFMASYLICLAVAVIGGLMMSRLTKRIHLPAVTAYLVAGLVLGPFCLGALGVKGLGFQSLEQVEGLGVLTQTALGFIAFSMGSEFRLHQLKAMGTKAIIIGIVQAVVTTLLVDALLIGLHFAFPQVISLPAALYGRALTTAESLIRFITRTTFPALAPLTCAVLKSRRSIITRLGGRTSPFCASLRIGITPRAKGLRLPSLPTARK